MKIMLLMVVPPQSDFHLLVVTESLARMRNSGQAQP